MSIPVANVFHLLTYAWAALRDPDEARDAAPLPTDTRLPHLLATELARTTEQLLRRGLLHQYVAQPAEDLSRLRGKLLIAQTLRTHALTRGRAWCAPDDFVPDTLSNRLIRSTVHYLLHSDALAVLDAPATATLRHRLAALYPRLPPGPLLPVTTAGARLFSTIRPTRATAPYRLPLRLCRLIWLLSQAGAESPTDPDPWLRALLLDDRRMAKLFEKFVRNFCAHHYATAYRTSATTMRWWFAPDAADAHTAHVPQMQTDVLVRHRATQVPRLLIECKYYPKALTDAAHGHKKKLHTAHLYQLNAYYRHLDPPPSSTAPFDALLLYPLAHSGALAQAYALPNATNHYFRIATLNLNQAWGAVEAELREILALD